ncbi:MAG: hypothetical protein CFE44_19755 [Burkholderiales bacterium PBB4]|nr:MAG: hypothetical protein CFE44_19755 [Burkholderiales bacterium PBB4]
MQNVSIETQLDIVETKLNDAMSCLTEGDAQALMDASASLQATAMTLVQLMHTHRKSASPKQYGMQIGQLAQKLIELRENLVRRSAYVDRALQVVLPTADLPSYQSRSPYGAAMRSSGNLRAISA